MEQSKQKLTTPLLPTSDDSAQPAAAANAAPAAKTGNSGDTIVIGATPNVPSPQNEPETDAETDTDAAIATASGSAAAAVPKPSAPAEVMILKEAAAVTQAEAGLIAADAEKTNAEAKNVLANKALADAQAQTAAAPALEAPTEIETLRLAAEKIEAEAKLTAAQAAQVRANAELAAANAAANPAPPSYIPLADPHAPVTPPLYPQVDDLKRQRQVAVPIPSDAPPAYEPPATAAPATANGNNNPKQPLLDKDKKDEKAKEPWHKNRYVKAFVGGAFVITGIIVGGILGSRRKSSDTPAPDAPTPLQIYSGSQYTVAEIDIINPTDQPITVQGMNATLNEQTAHHYWGSLDPYSAIIDESPTATGAKLGVVLPPTDSQGNAVPPVTIAPGGCATLYAQLSSNTNAAGFASFQASDVTVNGAVTQPVSVRPSNCGTTASYLHGTALLLAKRFGLLKAAPSQNHAVAQNDQMGPKGKPQLLQEQMAAKYAPPTFRN